MTVQNMTSISESDQKDFSLVKFFNCYDLSDCTLEIVEEDENGNSVHPLDEKEPGESNDSSKMGDRTILEQDQPSRKKRKLENCSVLKKVDEYNEQSKTILFIHSLLFCSNSDFFQKLLMSGTRQRNINLVLQPGETEYFTQLIKLFYDDGQITNLTVSETAHVLKFAKRYKCANVTNKLLQHISSFKIISVSTLNKSIEVYNDLLDADDKNMRNTMISLKDSCLRYLKVHFCPVEKIFGPLLFDFVRLSGLSLLFFLDCIDSGIAVCENTVVGLVLYWLEYNSIMNIGQQPEFALKLLKKCRFEYVNVSYIMDVMCLPQPCWISETYHQFYLQLLEYHACSAKTSYFPDYPKRSIRNRNFAFDHEMFLYFAPTDSKVHKEKEHGKMLLTAEHNVAFIRGYQLHFSAGAYNTDDTRELRVKISVENLNRMPHSQLVFSMLYAIASPSVSNKFSPWNHCTFLVESCKKSSWAVISLIAKHSLINETGFYLKFYLE